MNTGIIRKVCGRRVWDSRGRPTVEADVILESGLRGRAIAPAGASRGKNEAVELRDVDDENLQGLDVRCAILKIDHDINNALCGMDVREQETIDARLIALDGTGNKSNLGGNSTIAVSMAVAHAAAAESGKPLYSFLLGDKQDAILPLPQIQIFGGGAHAQGRIDFQDFMIMPGTANSFSEAIEWCARVYIEAGKILEGRHALAGVADEGGYWPNFKSNEETIETLIKAIENAGFIPGEEIGIALDIAASEFFDGHYYNLSLEDKQYDSDGMSEWLQEWVDRYPIWSIEDPLSEEDVEGMSRFTSAVGDRIQVVGDDFLVTNSARIKNAAKHKACNAVLIKPNQAGTLTETYQALSAAKEENWGIIVSARSGESEDNTIAHLAVGWGAGQLKVGSMTRSERLAKWNEVIRIEEKLGAKARYAGADILPFNTL